MRAIIDIAEICAQHGIKHAVISPGSRNALLTLAFARHPAIEVFIVPDERSAGFIALGLAQSSGLAVPVICTSGTAAINLYPAITESFYRQISLIALTADRPAEWIDQADGQTIRQQIIFRNHILNSFEFPETIANHEGHWHAHRVINEAIITCTRSGNMGPVHINIPIREPFYPEPGDILQPSKDIKIIQEDPVHAGVDSNRIDQLSNALITYSRKLLVVGQTLLSEQMKEYLEILGSKCGWVILGDVTSNLHGISGSIQEHDLILLKEHNKDLLEPEIVLTFGQSVLSKRLKTFLRSVRMEHWHIGEETQVIDTFQNLTKRIKCSPVSFFEYLISKQDVHQDDHAYPAQWTKSQNDIIADRSAFFNKEQAGEISILNAILKRIPPQTELHLANSMSVRYVNMLENNFSADTIVHSNRGTSGIDGCVSTAVGHALNNKNLNILITGDLAFFYDRNGLWHNYLPKNLKIIILNNHGGIIFKMIDGAKSQPEADQYFVTNQKLSAANTAADFDMKYVRIHDIQGIDHVLEEFLNIDSGASILEIETSQNTSLSAYERFMERMKKVN